ncbi:MAG: hypothetical protein ABII10_02855, partial [Candidatus Paceibacterota bacterium]
TWDNMEGAQVSWEKLMDKIQQFLAQKDNDPEPTETQLALEENYKNRFFNQVENDLHTPEALAVMWEMAGNEQLTAAQHYHLLLSFDEVLGLGLAKIEPAEDLAIPAEVQALVDERKTARIAQDWHQSDDLREQIERLGYRVEDGEGGQQLKKLKL